MRILYLNPCGKMGGAETSLVELLASLRAAAPEWELVLVLGEEGPLSDKAEQMGVRVVMAPFPQQLSRVGDVRRGWFDTISSLGQAVWATATYSRRLAAIIRSERPDVVHTNGLKMHLLGAWNCPPQIPLIWHIHDYAGARRLTSRLLRSFAKRCAAAIVNSDSVGSDLRALIPGLRITTVYNAVDLERFSPVGSKVDLDAMAGLPAAPSATVRVGLVGTFARWKGHEVFLRALSKLPADAPVRGYVIGGAIYQTDGSQWSLPELREETSRLGLSGRVGFTGFLNDTASAMRSLDIVVHASTQPEPFGMVIIEGMACGRAVVASRAGGAVEIFEDGQEAIGHLPGDAEALASQISRLASDASLRSSLGRAGRTKVERLFHGARLSRQLMDIYNSAANDKQSGSVIPINAEASAHSE